MMDDDLKRLLGSSGNPARDSVREAIRKRTSRTVRMQPIWRRIRLGSALAACFVAGAVLAYFGKPTTERVILVERPVSSPEPSRPVPAPTVPTSPHELELLAEQAENGEAARLFVSAARKYMQSGAIESAVRCYSHAYELAPDLTAVDARNDDWLAMSLKVARNEENDR